MTKDEWYKQLFDKLGSSRFRSRFHLAQKDIGYINEKGLDFENFRSRMFGGPKMRQQMMLPKKKQMIQQKKQKQNKTYKRKG